MKRPFTWLILGFLGLAGAARAMEDIPHLQFVRGLRARNYPDLALEYLRKLQKNPPAEVAPFLPLEMGRTLLSLAATENNVGKRQQLYRQAQEHFDEFLKKNAQSPLAAQARLGIAHISILKAKAQLARALREEPGAERQKEVLAARETVAAAGQQLMQVIEDVDKQIPSVVAETAPAQGERAAWEQISQEARLDLALNYLDQASTYLDAGDNEALIERAGIVQKAILLLENLARGNHQSSLTWQARAWLGRCYHEIGEFDQARKRFAEVIAQTQASALAGKRLARYFQMRLVLANPKAEEKDCCAVVRRLADSWMKDYSGSLNTPEGCGIRILYARCSAEMAQASKDAFRKRQLFQDARKQCEALERTENEFTSQARRLRYSIISAQGGFQKNIAQLTSFEDCKARADYEVYQLTAQLPEKKLGPAELDEQRQKHIRAVIQALERALSLAKDKTHSVDPADLRQAQSMLAGYYLYTKEYRKTVEIGELAARGQPQNTAAATAASYVLQAYTNIINTSLTKGDTLEDLVAERQHLRQLAEYMERAWPQEPAGDLARHHLGLLLMTEKQFPEAVAMLARISPRYAGLIFVKYQIFTAATQAEQDKAEPKGTDKRPFAQQARAALESMPELINGADTATTSIYLQGKIDLGRLLYRSQEYEKMEKLVEQMRKRLPTMNLAGEPKRQQAQTDLVILYLHAKYGEADKASRAGKSAEASTIVQEIVKGIQEGKYQELRKSPLLRSGLMDLALRTYIEANDTTQALETLAAFQKLQGEDEPAAKVDAILHRLSVVIRKQVTAMRQRHDTKEQIEKTIDNFSTFVNALAAQQKTPTPQFLRLLAVVYDSLGKHDKAIEQLKQVPAPQGDGSPAGDAKEQLLRASRVLYVQQLRLANRLEEAETLCKELRASKWGASSFELQKEQIHFEMAHEKWVPAYKKWQGLTANLVPKVATDARVKEQYFECYFYQVQCLYKYGLKQANAQKRQQLIQRAAKAIFNLEKSWPDLGSETAKARFMEMLENHADLKREYDTLKGRN